MASIAIGSGLGISIASTGDVKPAAEWSRGVATTEISNLFILDNSPHANGQAPDGSNDATLWEYSVAGNLLRRIQLPDVAGRGHGFTVLASGHIVIATSENAGGNANESWFLVPPGADGILAESECRRIRCEQLFGGTAFTAIGSRHAFKWGEQIIIGTNGVWKPVTLDAWEMSDGELAALPGWRYDGTSNSLIGDYDVAIQPGTDRLIVQGENCVGALDLTLPTNNLATTTHNSTTVPGGDGLDWLMRGTNVGASTWEGFIAFGPDNEMAKTRGAIPDVAFWNATTIAGLPKLGDQPGANPAPDKILTCPLWDAFNLNVESVFVAIEYDSSGGLWVLSYSYDSPTFSPGKRYHFSPAAVAAGGEQMPDFYEQLPAESQGSYMRMALQFALHHR
jgi:hypothetical protein